MVGEVQSFTCLIQYLLNKLRSHGPNVCAICCAGVCHNCGLQMVELSGIEESLQSTAIRMLLFSCTKNTAATPFGLDTHNPNLTAR